MPEFEVGTRTASGYVAVPQRGHGPGVLVLHAWWGLTPFFKNVCDQLAAEGFVAFAPDRYGGPTAATIEEAEALQRQREDPVRTEAALGASVEFLSALRPWSERDWVRWASRPGPHGRCCSRCASPIW